MHEEKKSPSLLELVMSKGVTLDKEDINRLILESLDVVLDETLGKPMRQAFYDLLERNYYISREGIPSQLGDFLLILERNFGKNGKAIRRDIAQRLTQNLVARKH
ncbi:MAG TPA: hypothetical protein VK503_10940 [Candidatus Bathyarchaeia archaeon]|nr:hypothetical protein [Candidatus Bathyarchaeia archaeon]